MTAIHTRNKNIRNLFRAEPIKNKNTQDNYSLVSRREIDKGWKSFWLNRGITKPPRVSDRYVGEFDLPTTLPKTQGES